MAVDSHLSNPAQILNAIASLLSAIAWPLVAITILIMIYKNAEQINKFISQLIKSTGISKIKAVGIEVDFVEQIAEESSQAAIKTLEKSEDGSNNDAAKIKIRDDAKSAADVLLPKALSPEKRYRVLWVDDHPENNFNLQFAFQALGIIVICIESNMQLVEAFKASNGFDAVITDMYRDGIVGKTSADSEAGLKTIQLIQENNLKTKIIVYAGIWAAQHKNDKLTPPVILISNNTQVIYNTILEEAIKKAES